MFHTQKERPSTTLLQALRGFFLGDTDDVWRLYRMTGGADSVPSAVTEQLARQARAVR